MVSNHTHQAIPKTEINKSITRPTAGGIVESNATVKGKKAVKMKWRPPRFMKADRIKPQERLFFGATMRLPNLEERCFMDTLTLHQAAQTLAGAKDEVHATEVELARAIEHGDLHANVKRWATEQWEGQQLPGNINRLETLIDRRELDAWQQRRARN
jgi:hypothetical protein